MLTLPLRLTSQARAGLLLEKSLHTCGPGGGGRAARHGQQAGQRWGSQVSAEKCCTMLIFGPRLGRKLLPNSTQARKSSRVPSPWAAHAHLDAVDVVGVLADQVDDAEERVGAQSTPPGPFTTSTTLSVSSGMTQPSWVGLRAGSNIDTPSRRSSRGLSGAAHQRNGNSVPPLVVVCQPGMVSEAGSACGSRGPGFRQRERR